MYNYDHAGLFYQQLPNVIYSKKYKRKDFKGEKNMKDKSRITAIIFTAANGKNIPIGIVGNPKKPIYFSLVPIFPMPFTNQHNLT